MFTHDAPKLPIYQVPDRAPKLPIGTADYPHFKDFIYPNDAPVVHTKNALVKLRGPKSLFTQRSAMNIRFSFKLKFSRRARRPIISGAICSFYQGGRKRKLEINGVGRELQ